MSIPAPPRRALVVPDVGPSRGIGHVMRCLALAEELRDRGSEVTFVASLETVDFARRQVEERGFGWVGRPEAASELLAVVDRLTPDAVVVDSYTLPPSTYVALRRRATTLCLVDGDPTGVDADIVVDQNIGAESDPWAAPEGGVRLAGLTYALMRQEILLARSTSRRREGTPPTVLAFFGGTDAFGAAPLTAQALIGTGRPFRLRVVGATPDLRQRLLALRSGSGQSLEVLEPSDDLAAEVTRADLVVGAAGSSSWELLCLGAACAFVCVTGNQAQGYARVTSTGIAAPLGTLESLRSDAGPATRTLSRLLAEPQERARLATAGRDLVDGRGRERVADALARMCRVRPGASGLI